MATFSMRQSLDHAAKQGCGVPALEDTCDGVRKVNIETDTCLSMVGAIRPALARDKSEFVLRKLFKEATAAAMALGAERCKAFGCAGRAVKIKLIPLPSMTEAYRKREPRQIAA